MVNERVDAYVFREPNSGMFGLEQAGTDCERVRICLKLPSQCLRVLSSDGRRILESKQIVQANPRRRVSRMIANSAETAKPKLQSSRCLLDMNFRREEDSHLSLYLSLTMEFAARFGANSLASRFWLSRENIANY